MLKAIQIMLICALLISLRFGVIEARPQNNDNSIQDTMELLEPDVEEMRSTYYDLPAQSPYANIPLSRLQMLVAQYRPNAYSRSPVWNNMNELFRVPESKRQVRYRQCYFNPISCFKK